MSFFFQPILIILYAYDSILNRYLLCILKSSKLVIGTTKAFTLGKEISFGGHTHSASNITSGTLSIARGGTGATSASAARSALGAAAAQVTSLQSEIDSLKSSVSNGKSAVASAITDKGVSTSATASFDTMAENIRSIGSNGKFSIGSLFPVYSEATGSNQGYAHVDTTLNEIYRFSIGVNVHRTNSVCIVVQYPFHGYQEGTARPVYMDHYFYYGTQGIVLTFDMDTTSYYFAESGNIKYYAKLITSSGGAIDLSILASNNISTSIRPSNIGYTLFANIDQSMADMLKI